MASICRRAYFFDNTDTLISFAEVIPNGFLQIKEKLYYKVEPLWFRDNILKKWDKSKVRIIR